MDTSEILMFYEMFDDNDISTERLLAMTADAAGCDVGDVVDALAAEYTPGKGKKPITYKSNKGKRKRNRRHRQ